MNKTILLLALLSATAGAMAASNRETPPVTGAQQNSASAVVSDQAAPAFEHVSRPSVK